jgi:hypothetical protein
MTYNVGLKCYIVWVGKKHAPTILSPNVNSVDFLVCDTIHSLYCKKYTPFFIFSITYVIMSLYPILWHILHHTGDHQVHHKCHLITIGSSSTY